MFFACLGGSVAEGTSSNFFQTALELLKQQVPREEGVIWLDDLEFVDADDSGARYSTASHFKKDRITRQYLARLNRILSDGSTGCRRAEIITRSRSDKKNPHPRGSAIRGARHPVPPLKRVPPRSTPISRSNATSPTSTIAWPSNARERSRRNSAPSAPSTSMAPLEREKPTCSRPSGSISSPRTPSLKFAMCASTSSSRNSSMPCATAPTGSSACIIAP